MKKFFQSEPVSVIFKAESALVDRLDEYARVTQTSRSWIIRQALETMFSRTPKPAARQIEEQICD